MALSVYCRSFIQIQPSKYPQKNDCFLKTCRNMDIEAFSGLLIISLIQIYIVFVRKVKVLTQICAFKFISSIIHCPGY